MTEQTHLRVQLVSATQYLGVDLPGFPDYDAESTATDGGSEVAELAGRACYQSFSRPSVKTRTNRDYLAHILEVGHGSVLEHGSVTFYIEGVSRALTHELIRHRHLSYSQLSQRYVDESDLKYVVPPAIVNLPADTSGGADILDGVGVVAQATAVSYSVLVQELEARGVVGKKAREAARTVLMNGTETKIVVTGNYRAWRHFLRVRAALAADAEIRGLALELLTQLKSHAPAVFSDFTFREQDGLFYAETEHYT